ncbi:MAG: DUF4838 domain-containing protein [Bacteroidota bacterium]|nr:DUF4838 domain-containing protein [Bacteroidota bacterium]
MKIKIFLILTIALSALKAEVQKINLVEKHKSKYCIVLSSNASKWDSLASKELQNYIKLISGAYLPIISDSSPVSDHEIILGQNKHSKDPDLSKLNSDDSYIIESEKGNIYLTGRKGKGTLYAVYTFLEKYLGCRAYSSKVIVTPKKSSIVLSKLDLIENPAFDYRDVHYFEQSSDDYCHWQKLLDSEGKKTWGLYVHTFQTLLPVDKYFKSHPEYFALRNGIRVPDEPCLSNPDVLKIMTEELRKRIKDNPNAKIWSVSQNDNYGYCQCPECSRLDSIEGSPSASVINFVNKIAREFPDRTISTLAYQYSRKAPKTVKPEKNVNIMLCTIECYRTKPLETDSSSSSFTSDLKEWAAVTNNIMIWDYVVQFTNLMSPFPNFQVLQPNIQLFKKYNAKMIFEQGAGPGSEASEFEELRCYILAKLLWNPKLNVDSLMNDFLTGYYGKAGKYIKQYITLMKDELLKSKANLWIYANPVESMQNYLRPELMEKYNGLFDKAERAVSTQAEFLSRVKAARLPIKYAMLEQAKVIGTGKNGTFIKDNSGNFVVSPKIKKLLEEFSKESKLAGKQTIVNEKALSTDTYVSRYNAILEKSMKNPLALFKPVKFITTPSSKYAANGTQSLTDGLCGDEDHHFNWLGFEGEDMEVIIDLQKQVEIKKVSTDFLELIYSWIFPPEQIDISVSEDGSSFKTVANQKISLPQSVEEAPKGERSIIHNYSFNLAPVKARYVKVLAKSIKNCPIWHAGYPYKAWIFTDEIVVE